MRKRSLLLLSLILSGCQRDPAEPTAEENQELDEAANLLNEAPANLEAIDDSGLGEANAADGTAPNDAAMDAGAY